MPNKRSKDKRSVSVYVPAEVKEALESESRRLGVPMSELITRFYRDALEQRGYKFDKEECDD